MYYIEKDNKIVLFHEDKGVLENTLKFTPEYADLEIQETERPIVNFRFADTPEYEEEQAQVAKRKRIDEIKFELRQLDESRIRAIAEPSIKDEETGETWLEYYNGLVLQLRAELNELEK